MATAKGQEFIDKYKGTDCLKSSWEMMYKKGHLTLEEFVECAMLTDEERESYIVKKETLTSEEQIANLIQQVEEMDVIIAELLMMEVVE